MFSNKAYPKSQKSRKTIIYIAMKKVVCLLCLICLLPFSFTLKAQQGYEDVLYLKNGSIIKGIVIEQIPNQSIKIQAKDGSIFVYNIAEVEKVTKEKTGNNVSDISNLNDSKYKNPGTALLWSILIPGAGQFYNGQYGKGLLMLGIDAVAFAAISTYGYSTYTSYYGYYSSTEPTDVFYIGMAAILANSLWSILDASKSAKEINRKNGLALNFKLSKDTNLSLSPDFKVDGLGIGLVNPTFGAKLSLAIN